jgi:hypothetical protein
MKKLIGLFVFIALISISGLKAQESKEVPAQVKSSFEKKHPNIKDVKWSKEEGAYEAQFTENGKKMTVHVNRNGEETANEYYIKVSELPQKAQDYLKTNYSGTEFREVSKVVSLKGKTHYEVETKGKELLFDDRGNFLKEEKENDNG